MRRSLTTSILSAALLLSLAACSATPSTVGGGNVEVGDETILIDVRTAEEYATGHLEGARLLDFTGGDLADAIPSLDPEAEYLVYCRSGNRAGQAIALMEQAGFTNLTNLGSVENAAQLTGLPITR